MSPSPEWKAFHVRSPWLSVNFGGICPSSFFSAAPRNLRVLTFHRLFIHSAGGAHCWKCQRRVHSYVTRPLKLDSLQALDLSTTASAVCWRHMALWKVTFPAFLGHLFTLIKTHTHTYTHGHTAYSKLRGSVMRMWVPAHKGLIHSC